MEFLANTWFGIWWFSHAAKDFTDMANAFTISRNLMALNVFTSLYYIRRDEYLYFGRICGVAMLWESMRRDWTVESLSQCEDVTRTLDPSRDMCLQSSGAVL